jgi:hypothetical protein
MAYREPAGRSARQRRPERRQRAEGIDGIRALLQRRAGDCWDRLDDAADELATVHGARRDEILRHLMRRLATGPASDA